MNKIATKKPQVGATLKAGLALYVWQFKKNALVLLPVIIFQIYVQHRMLKLLPQLSTPSEPQATSIFMILLTWYLLSSVILVMAYTDITRRLFGFPVQINTLSSYFTYVYWLFKRALTVLIVLLVTLLSGMAIVVAFAIVMGVVLRTLGVPLSADAPTWLSASIMTFGLAIGIVLVTHLALICFPVVVDKNEGPIGSLRHGLSMIKPYRHYGYQMAMILFMVLVLPNMIVGSLTTFFAVKPEMPLSQFVLPAFISTSIGDLMMLFLICLQLAIYQQLHADKKA